MSSEREVDDLDAFGLLAGRAAPPTRFGASDAGPAMDRGTFNEALSKLPKARMRLRSDLARGLLIDYLAPVQVGYGQAKQFVGDVLTATPDADRIELDLATMPELEESTTGAMATWDVTHHEMVYILARTAGLDDEQVNIYGLDALPHELFEIVVPVDGISVAEPTTIGGCRLVPASVITARLAELTEDEPLLGPFARASCAAIALASGSRLLDAEAAALTRIDHALAWIAVSLRYGLTHWPDGRPVRFARTAFHALPVRVDKAWVRGLGTARQLVHDTGPTAHRPQLDLDRDHLVGEPPALWSLQDRQAAAALRRAAAATDPIQAVTALWDAIEFYVAGTAAPELFSAAQLKALRKAVPDDLPAPLRARAIEAINRLNQPALLTRLRAAVEDDGVPTADDEWDLLRDLRRSRNALVHGAGAQAAASSREIARAAAFVARLLVHRAHRASEPR
jgi:hypothetical protein